MVRRHVNRVATALAALVLLSALVALLWPMLRDFSTYGFHDWDAETAYRYITPLSINHYGEGPWWHPYLCGGIPAWGYVEGAPNLVSPYLPFYLWLDVRSALRFEVLGNGALGLVGAYLLARRYSDSRALCAFFAALFGLNGRWALQAAVGHCWHLQYALVPWVFLGFERARQGDSWRPALWAGAVLAYICYAGGIYPLPHTALFLSLHALLCAAFSRRLRPLLVLAVIGVVAFGLSAPKLFAVLDYMSHAPRIIDSTETIGLRELFVMLTDTTQRYGSRPVPIPAYNWHEWGLYVGVVGFAALVLGLLLARGVAAQSYRVLGVLCLLLGLGAFHPYAPWPLLHELPPFSSQHVPSRFHYLMVFFLGLSLVGGVAPWVSKLTRAVRYLDLGLLALVALYCAELVRVNSVPFEQAFWMKAPPQITERAFEQRTNAPVNYVRRDWAAPMLLTMFANTGVLRCYGADPTLVPGARAADTTGYRGNAYIVNGLGHALLASWSPNRARVHVSGVTPGALLVYNMNYDASWSVNGAPALNHRGAVAARASADGDYEFAYFPRTLKYSLPLAALTLLSMIAVPWLRRRLRSRK